MTSGPDAVHGHWQGPVGEIANKNIRAFTLHLSAAATTQLQALTQDQGRLVVEHEATDQRQTPTSIAASPSSPGLFPAQKLLLYKADENRDLTRQPALQARELSHQCGSTWQS